VTAETGADGGAVMTRVLMTSAGVVKSEAIAPAQPPVREFSRKRKKKKREERKN